MMSPWFFNMCMDGVFRDVHARVRERIVEIVGLRDSRWRLNQLLYADDTV